MQVINYTIINHNARIELELSANDYMVADLIYNLSNNPSSDYPNWCYASKNTMADMLGLSKQSVLTIVQKLIDKKLVERHDVTKHLRTTKRWYNKVIIKTGKETLPPVKNPDFTGKETLPEGGKETLPNNDIYNNDINNDKNLATGVADGKRFNELLDKFKTINPNHEKFFSNKTERRALQELVDKYGFSKIEGLVSALPEIVEKPYAPRVTSPFTLQKKLAELSIFLKQEKAKGVSYGQQPRTIRTI